MDLVPLTPEQIVEAEARADKHGYLARLATGLDDFVNDIFGGNLDQTISSRCQQLSQAGNPFGTFMCLWLDKIQPNHGQLAEAGDLARANAQMELEQRMLNFGLSACCSHGQDTSPETWTPTEVCGEENGPLGIFVILRCPVCSAKTKVRG
jgi:hypothetical protein